MHTFILDAFQQSQYFELHDRSEINLLKWHCSYNLERGHSLNGWLTLGKASSFSEPFCFLLLLCHWRQREDGWFSLLPWLHAPPPSPKPVPPSVWKEAWCPLESPSQAKGTILPPGNLGPSQSPPPKAKWAWIGSFAYKLKQWCSGHWWGLNDPNSCK